MITIETIDDFRDLAQQLAEQGFPPDDLVWGRVRPGQRTGEAMRALEGVSNPEVIPGLLDRESDCADVLNRSLRRAFFKFNGRRVDYRTFQKELVIGALSYEIAERMNSLIHEREGVGLERAEPGREIEDLGR